MPPVLRTGAHGLNDTRLAPALSIGSILFHTSCGRRAMVEEDFMFRHIEGCKAQHGDMTLMIAHNFVEWHVMIIKSPTILIQGDRQLSEEKARAHARQLAESYLSEERHEEPVGWPTELTWAPLETGDWVAWRH